MNDRPTDSEHPIGGRRERQWFITRSIWYTVPGTVAAVAAAYLVLPALAGMEHATDRLFLAVRWLAVALLPYVAVCLHITGARLIEGSHDPLAGQESASLKAHCRVMQNTLEQLVWFAFSVLALSTFLSPGEARLIPILCVAFALARFIYWWGYLRAGTLGRAPGVQITLALNVPLLVVVLARLVRDWAA